MKFIGLTLETCELHQATRRLVSNEPAYRHTQCTGPTNMTRVTSRWQIAKARSSTQNLEHLNGKPIAGRHKQEHLRNTLHMLRGNMQSQDVSDTAPNANTTFAWQPLANTCELSDANPRRTSYPLLREFEKTRPASTSFDPTRAREHTPLTLFCLIFRPLYTLEVGVFFLDPKHVVFLVACLACLSHTL